MMLLAPAEHGQLGQPGILLPLPCAVLVTAQCVRFQRMDWTGLTYPTSYKLSLQSGSAVNALVVAAQAELQEPDWSVKCSSIGNSMARKHIFI